MMAPHFRIFLASSPDLADDCHAVAASLGEAAADWLLIRGVELEIVVSAPGDDFWRGWNPIEALRAATGFNLGVMLFGGRVGPITSVELDAALRGFEPAGRPLIVAGFREIPASALGDDDAVALLVLQQGLQMAGHCVTVFSTAEALNATIDRQLTGVLAAPTRRFQPELTATEERDWRAYQDRLRAASGRGRSIDPLNFPVDADRTVFLWSARRISPLDEGRNAGSDTHRSEIPEPTFGFGGPSGSQAQSVDPSAGSAPISDGPAALRVSPAPIDRQSRAAPDSTTRPGDAEAPESAFQDTAAGLPPADPRQPDREPLIRSTASGLLQRAWNAARQWVVDPLLRAEYLSLLRPAALITVAGDRALPAAAPEPVPAEAASDPVYFGVSTPSHCAPGDRFEAALSTYVASARESARRKLERVVGPGVSTEMDFPPDRAGGWRIGAPVSVTLSAEGATVEPPRIDFEWNGSLHVAAFTVTVDADAAFAVLRLGFQVALAGVPIAHIPNPVPLDDPLAASAASPRPARASCEQRALSSAFASYASADASTVGYCLSALSRWSPGLAIFQDCLDLDPGEAFKPQLAQAIADHDAFLLFWSRPAAASPWVRWEFETARAAKGLDAVIPMPLEDPRLAPPPPGLDDQQWRDRFMVARLALERVDAIAKAAGASN